MRPATELGVRTFSPPFNPFIYIAHIRAAGANASCGSRPAASGADADQASNLLFRSPHFEKSPRDVRRRSKTESEFAHGSAMVSLHEVFHSRQCSHGRFLQLCFNPPATIGEASLQLRLRAVAWPTRRKAVMAASRPARQAPIQKRAVAGARSKRTA